MAAKQSMHKALAMTRFGTPTARLWVRLLANDKFDSGPVEGMKFEDLA
jgi:hypothetical protein